MLELFEIKQYFDSPSLSLTSLKTKIEKEMDKLLSCTPLPANASVAITAGAEEFPTWHLF